MGLWFEQAFSYHVDYAADPSSQFSYDYKTKRKCYKGFKLPRMGLFYLPSIPYATIMRWFSVVGANYCSWPPHNMVEAKNF